MRGEHTERVRECKMGVHALLSKGQRKCPDWLFQA